jgi:rare lipoprotein A
MFKRGLIFSFLLVAGCVSQTSQPPIIKDGLPRNLPANLQNTPDAIPKWEPDSRYGNPESYVVFGKKYTPLKSRANYHKQGIASWYGKKFHGKRTSSGDPYDMFAMTAAHKTLPLPTYAQVTNVDNGKKVIVKINDRGPFHEGRIIDLSYAAAYKLGIADRGTGNVIVKVIEVEQSKLSKPQSPMWLQIGAFSNQKNAEKLKNNTQQNSAIKNIIITKKQSGKVELYRVKVGPLYSIEDADKVDQQLSQLGIKSSRLLIRSNSIE